MKKPSVAVLLAAFNGAEWIKAQLDSIQVQQGVDVEIFISVDESIDATIAECQRYVLDSSNVTLLPDLGRLGGAGKNFYRLLRDVDVESFDYVAFADQDDLWLPDKLARAVSVLSVGGFGGYSSDVLAFWPDGREQILGKAHPQVRWDHLFEAAGPGCTYVLSTCLAKAVKELIVDRWADVQQVTLHDWLVYAIARSSGYTWYIDPVPSMRYRQHHANVVGANSGWRALRARWAMVRSGWWFHQILLISALCSHPWPVLNCKTARRRFALLKLAYHARECRRRPRDKALFAVLCLAMFIVVKTDA